MARHQIDIHVADEYIPLTTKEHIRKVAAASLNQVSPRKPLSMDIAIVDDEAVKRLNKQYRGLDENTDVLSFSLISQGHYYGEEDMAARLEWEESFVLPPGLENDVGEVVISYDQAKKQAETAGHSVQKEIDLLIIHGVLHLMGYDHMEPGEEVLMKKMEEQILETLTD